jgi:hypothetical protein
MLSFAKSLPPRRALFVLEYAKDLNGTQAAIRAGYAPDSAHVEAARLLEDSDVQTAVQDLLAERARELKIEASDVLRQLIEIAIADPNDLVQYRRTCCRFCWGDGHLYQRTPNELTRDRESHDLRELDLQRKDERHQPRAFDEAGGTGYNALKAPHEACPECFGQGIETMHIADTRHLRGPARRLYAGAKRTKDGVEIKMHDQDKARELIGRHLGMFLDRVKHEVDDDVANLILAARKRSG